MTELSARRVRKTAGREGTALLPGSLGLGADGRAGATRVKVCGCTSAADAAAAVAAGADAVGLIFASSPRRISPEQGATVAVAVPAQVSIVGVFIDPSPEELEHALLMLPRLMPQFSGSEPPELCRYLGIPYLKVFPVAAEAGLGDDALSAELKRYPEALPIFETASQHRGGSGRTFDWPRVSGLVRRRRSVISGGLTAANVSACVRLLRPYAVDVRSGVESAGVKDASKLRAFIRAVRAADATA